MNKRYFYTDPLAAAWMAKHHGMRFPIPKTPYRPDGNDYAVTGILSCLSKGLAGKFYIHPDSLHLLEPQQDDVILTYDIHRFAIAAKWSELNKQGIVDWNVDRPIGTAIIQRNGLAFHWPETEG